MDTQFWLDTFRFMAGRIGDDISRYAGTKEGALILGKGASGDMTLKIDQIAEDIVVDKLETLHTNYGHDFELISEELGYRTYGGEPATHIVIDPVDGSFNARQGIPYYATALAAADGSKVGDATVALVKNLATGDVFHAVRGQGAFCNNRPLTCRQVEIPRAFVFEAAHNKAGIKRVMPLLEMFERARSLGSTALDICYLAAGSIDVFFYPVPSRSIDYVAGKLILEEAGGMMTGMSGENLDNLPLNLDRSCPFIAAGSRKTMQKMMDIISLSRI
jgi:myo-inositol-1(or 4)-monophosphatase